METGAVPGFRAASMATEHARGTGRSTSGMTGRRRSAVAASASDRTLAAHGDGVRGATKRTPYQRSHVHVRRGCGHRDGRRGPEHRRRTATRPPCPDRRRSVLVLRGCGLVYGCVTGRYPVGIGRGSTGGPRGHGAWARAWPRRRVATGASVGSGGGVMRAAQAHGGADLPRHGTLPAARRRLRTGTAAAGSRRARAPVRGWQRRIERSVDAGDAPVHAQRPGGARSRCRCRADRGRETPVVARSERVFVGLEWCGARVAAGCTRAGVSSRAIDRGAGPRTQRNAPASRGVR